VQLLDQGGSPAGPDAARRSDLPCLDAGDLVPEQQLPVLLAQSSQCPQHRRAFLGGQ
jgi:hypothetical protein